VLPATFYERPTLEVARDLVGKLLFHHDPGGPTAGLIVEVEAYIGETDPACHAAVGPTRRNAPLYGPAGYAYLYLNYGMHVLVNAVTEREGFPAAVLVRALDPVLGLDRMRARRASRLGDPALDHDLCRGPGRLSRALGLTLDFNHARLDVPPLVIADVGVVPAAIAWTTRVGISVGNEHAWRAHATPSPCVSAWREGTRAGRRERTTRPGAAGPCWPVAPES
jgi:DNA-3-methyladenine glycosylase